MLGVSEAPALGQSLGVAASTLTKIFNYTSACCWSSDTYNPVPGVIEGLPSSRDYDGGFSSNLMVKDLNLVVESVEKVGGKYPLTSQAQKIYAEICKCGHEARDFSCAFRHYYLGWTILLTNKNSYLMQKVPLFSHITNRFSDMAAWNCHVSNNEGASALNRCLAIFVLTCQQRNQIN